MANILLNGIMKKIKGSVRRKQSSRYACSKFQKENPLFNYVK